MLRLLSWNAYDKLSMLSPQMFVPPQGGANVSTSETSTNMKRKRPADHNDEGKIAKRAPGRPKLSKNKTQPSVSANETTMLPATDRALAHAPEGLPTPISSPTDVKMQSTSTEDQVQGIDLSKEARRRRRTQQVISQQINLEILLKHDELRLIDQELAKCQTALEQLRRCTEVPYPSTNLFEGVSSGRGPANRNSFSGRLPSSPAPWGVADGPYSRHYSQWLLPDSRFDGGEPEAPTAASGKRPAKGRIRGSFAEDHSLGVQSRSQRGSQLKSLPAGYGQPKEKVSGPLLLKRKSDGVMVRLVCQDCGRHDFGSAQGFINHCRIGHTRNFASHDAAAEKCGEPVEYDENGAMIGVEPVPAPISSFVHPLIRSARLLPSENDVLLTATRSSDDKSQTLTRPRNPRPHVSPDFRASTITPNLSDLIKNKGFGLDLQDIVTDAKLKIELSESDDESLDEESESPTPPEHGQHPHVAGTRGISKPAKSPHASPLLQSRLPVMSTASQQAHFPSSMRGGDGDNQSFAFPHGQLAEPSPTNESNQAPSLIDDDEEMEAPSPSSSSASEQGEEGEVDFHVQDEDDTQQVALTRSDFQPSCAQRNAPIASTPRTRRPSALRRHADSHEEKHVSFASPSPAREIASPAKKRRKIAK